MSMACYKREKTRENISVAYTRTKSIEKSHISSIHQNYTFLQCLLKCIFALLGSRDLERKYIIYSNTSWGLSRLNTANKISTLRVPSGKLADRVGTTLP